MSRRNVRVGSLTPFLSSSVAGAADEDARSPRITEHPVSQVVRRKDPVTLRCRAEGTPSPSVVWTKDGELLAAGGGNRLTLPDGNLFFLSVEASDAGVYRCIASNEAGQAVSKNATLEDACEYRWCTLLHAPPGPARPEA
ncbi:Roundabout-like protein 2 [Frankliniella fusca]|uniref:Roundabout-like protein 2 n=1 Tax=Frankliniella fusca TaxID=407009 RepID=A0AAE1LMR4_9NEOP|nr:Roundabout-like protein 2 [Frankliniella fusca]